MIKANNILPSLHLIRRGAKVERADYTLRGKKRFLFFVLQTLSMAAGWGILLYAFFKLIF